MKPIHLSIAGLHSFREKQDIDFQTLCERGVFGIFGPTGSGKSSILDAMTLALYGKVERASNNTQGIINHAENELSVSFTFELEQAQGTETYRVERHFKRVSDVSVRTASCRLVRLCEKNATDAKGESIVMADKANEVQEKLYQLIGLTIDDFTRAVVLPQGKFAEFLTLKGVERRQMLQRLFHLEKYGDQLIAAIRERVNKAETRHKMLEAEQQGLGDASQEALTAVIEQLKRCEQRLQDMSQERKRLHEMHEKQKEVWQLQQELDIVEEKLKQLQDQEKEIDHLAQKLQLIKEAQRLHPYALERSTAEQELKMWQTKIQNMNEKIQKAKTVAAQAEKAYQHIWQTNEESIPRWMEKQNLLKQALEWQKELKHVVRDAKELQQQERRTAEKEKELARTVEQLQALLQKARERQQEIKVRLKADDLSIASKSELRQAYQAYLHLREEQGRVAEAEHAFRRQEQALQTLGERVKHAETEHQELEKRLKRFMNEWYSMVETLLRKKREAWDVLNNGYSLLVRLEQMIEHSKEQHYAAQLRARLQPGEPCPVCGSNEHSLPLSVDNDAEKETAELRQTYETFQLSVEFFKEQLQSKEKLLQQAEQAYYALYETIGHDDEVEGKAFVEQLAGAVDSIPSDHVRSTAYQPDRMVSGMVAEMDPDRLRKWSDEASKQLDAFQPLADRVQRLLAEQKRWRKEYQQVLNDWREIRSQYEASEQYTRAERQKFHKMKEKIRQLEETWRNTYSAFDLDSIEARYRSWEEKEKELDDLRQRLEKSEAFITQQQRELEKQQAQYQRLHVENVERRAKHEQTKQYIQSLTSKLNVYGENPAQQLEKLDKLMRDSKQQETDLKKNMEHKKEILRQVEKELAVAQESLKLGEARRQRAQEQWEEQTAESTFETPEQVLNSVVEQRVAEEWEERVETYRRNYHQWTQERLRLTERLRGRNMTREEWEDLQYRLNSLEQKYNALLQEKGALAKERSALEQRQLRYQQLEQQKLETETELERLGKLSTVFRGNSFVEYLAEEHLIRVCRDASVRLGALTGQRYALEIDSHGGFQIRDDANGGVKRPVSSLSGGETFLTSLSLALALSAQIQLRGKYPLSFFFLDEGFGTLDHALLDTVISSLEKLQTENLSVGVISHVPELRDRLPRKLIVQPAEPVGAGSRVHIETL